MCYLSLQMFLFVLTLQIVNRLKIISYVFGSLLCFIIVGYNNKCDISRKKENDSCYKLFKFAPFEVRYSLVANVTLIGGKTVIQSEQLLNCFQFDKYRSLVKSWGFSQGTYWFQQTMVKLIKDD